MSEEKRKFTISEKEYTALNLIRGLNHNAYMMVMTASEDQSGKYILEGTEEAYEELSQDLSDEIYYKLSSAANIKILGKVHDRLNPDLGGY